MINLTNKITANYANEEIIFFALLCLPMVWLPILSLRTIVSGVQDLEPFENKQTYPTWPPSHVTNQNQNNQGLWSMSSHRHMQNLKVIAKEVLEKKIVKEKRLFSGNPIWPPCHVTQGRKIHTNTASDLHTQDTMIRICLACIVLPVWPDITIVYLLCSKWSRDKFDQ